MRFIIEMGKKSVLQEGKSFFCLVYLADTTERTAPLVAYTRWKEEAVRLGKKEAEEEARQVKGRILRVAN